MQTSQECALERSALELILIRDEVCLFQDLHQSVHPEHLELADGGFVGAISVPIKEKNKTIGVISAARQSAWAFPSEIQREFVAICQYLEASLSRIRARKAVDKVLTSLEREANHDALTKLPNRNFFIKTLENEVEVCKFSNQTFAVLFIDLDDFKQVNDCMSHRTGDALLQSVAKRIKRQMRDNDMVARLGGDEFVVLVRNPKSNKQLQLLADRVLASLRRPFTIEQKKVIIGGSVGMSIFPAHGETADELMAHADIAMYAAKKKGKNHCQAFTESMAQEIKRRHNL